MSAAAQKGWVSLVQEMLEKYIQILSKAVNIYTGGRIMDSMHMTETKQQSTVWVFQMRQNQQNVRKKHIETNGACFFGINGHQWQQWR
ncbi:hypothetical protein NPIL_614171 [Nephila pilipes]|uniref:Uncharacterized protein n=1 Tax=Nephila pilipes TaxID=299642 RepID=A0A8X6PIG2_NEPPI|nr:hypothetical protein NPIL_614171 [Nephila pilipes]